MTTWIHHCWSWSAALLGAAALVAAACGGGGGGGGGDSHPTASSELVAWAENMCSVANGAAERERELLADARRMVAKANSEADAVRIASTVAQSIYTIELDLAADLGRLRVPSPAIELHAEIRAATVVRAAVIEVLAAEIELSESEADLTQAFANFAALEEMRTIPGLASVPDDVRVALDASPACQAHLEHEPVAVLEVHQRSPG